MHDGGLRAKMSGLLGLGIEWRIIPYVPVLAPVLRARVSCRNCFESGLGSQPALDSHIFIYIKWTEFFAEDRAKARSGWERP